MADDTKQETQPRYVKNLSDQDVFVNGHGTVPGGFEGELDGGLESVAGLVDEGVFADAKRPTAAQLKAAEKAEATTNDNDEKEGGADAA